MTIIAADTHYIVVGLGLTGLSCVRFLVSRGKKVTVVDSRDNPAGLADFKKQYPTIDVYCGAFDAERLKTASVLVMSPGVPLATPAIQQAISAGVRVTSDIELFLTEFNGTVIGITGSNAKSTVTAWLGDALICGGNKTLVAGNIGLPVLDALDGDFDFDITVLELSSFQLELIKKLNADVAVILNVSEDHMDRYDSMFHYQQAKQRIYFGCKAAVYNRSDMLTQPLVPDSTTRRSFGLSVPDLNDYGLRDVDGDVWLCRGFDQIIMQKDVSLPGLHNIENALSVLAIADLVGNHRDATISALKSFKGLPYRCQLIAEVEGVQYINDSKATNVGSTIAALNGLASPLRKNIHLLLGGQSKGQDLSLLGPAAAKVCQSVFAFGEDKHLLQQAVSQAELVENMESALGAVRHLAVPGDVVLLSPACASFDQFKNFEHRGQAFNEYVEALR